MHLQQRPATRRQPWEQRGALLELSWDTRHTRHGSELSHSDWYAAEYVPNQGHESASAPATQAASHDARPGDSPTTQARSREIAHIVCSARPNHTHEITRDCTHCSARPNHIRAITRDRTQRLLRQVPITHTRSQEIAHSAAPHSAASTYQHKGTLTLVSRQKA